ncbi:uncharacterized protein CcaverHIS019_0500430 [Cutaneotrichosporon cavernicola]|uniref:ER-bound oxygenase mpaB/mpaB'/Rubber oxygenase catalytic domain-containing protein n=1 Tax=Cutaneotrichosporon cavernicola TaxID=279322 RepID=A0AA48QWI3_9TREE|nr:uncharacterized protein CcaverHIS019_0500430 [Cutaneotrichosporon cavernicola]BEI92415.1 hypothetical protein CcaverHIS019_0500430 [Cutaneotrichosporon cavernicola]
MMDKYAYLLDDMSKMTYHEAEEISKYSSFLEMPWTVTVALSFALFKTYAIPTISGVLCKSGQLSTDASAGRRAEDTGIFINEFSGGGESHAVAGVDTERGSIALARMNWLHSRYGNLIGRDDKLFTLALFVFEPFYFAELFDYRPLNELEKEARYVHWREIGARMGIEDIPPTRAELLEWTVAYGKKSMVYDPRNAQVGNATFSVLLKDLPRFMWPLGKRMSLVLLDDHMLQAFGWEKPPALMYWLVPRLLRIKGLVCGNLLFPRTTPPPHVKTSVRCSFAGPVSEKTEKAPDAGLPQIVRDGYIFEPWYVKPDGARMGALGLGTPGLPKYVPEGYINSRLGPERLYNQGVDLTLKNAAAMRERAQGGQCPFFVAQEVVATA